MTASQVGRHGNYLNIMEKYLLINCLSVVSLNRPPVNSLNLEFMEDIIAALDQVEKDSKGMILTSANKSIFCAGLDLKGKVELMTRFFKITF